MASGFRSFKNGLVIESAPSQTLDGAGQLQFYSGSMLLHNGSSASAVITAAHTATLTNKTMSGASNTFSNIGYSSLVLTGSIVNADVNAAAAIAYSKLNLTGGIVNADVNASAAIAYSKLNLSGSIVNADISNSAAIARSKIATGTTNRLVINDSSTGALTEASAITASRALISDANGIPTHSSVTSTELGYVSGVTSSIQTQINSKLNLSGGTMSGSIDMNSVGYIQNLPTPVSPGDATNKSYVDAIAQGFDLKASVKCATTANITLSGEQTLDGVLTSTSRVLVKNQTAPEENGIYVSAAGAWTRATDMDSWTEVPGAFTFIEEGTLYGDTGWVCISNTGGTLGVTSISFTQFSSSGPYTTDGQGIELSGTQLSLELDGATLSKSSTGLKVSDNTFATVTLNNLGTTSINAHLLLNAAATYDLGDPTNYFRYIYGQYVGSSSKTTTGVYTEGLYIQDSFNNNKGLLSSGLLTPASNTVLGISSDTSVHLGLFTANNSFIATKNLYLETGNSSAASSGDIILQTGTASTTRGSITLNGLTINVPHLTASRVVQTDGSKNLESSSVTTTELGYVSGVTSSIQTQLDAKVPKTLTTTTGDMIYASSANTPARLPIGATNQVLKVSGGIPTWAAAPSGGVNYMASNPDAEGNVTTGFATYADAAGTSPVDGTGGSATTTWTATATNPLRGTYSFLLTKDASDRQGEGVSFDFTIDKADKGKVLQGSFDYAIASGTFADDDVSVWIYDVTNSTLIQPAPYKLKNHSLDSERFPFEFQTSSSSTSYRLIIHVASTSASAYTLKFDNFNLGPQAKLYGSPITDLVSTSYTLTGASSNPTKGTIVTDKCYTRKSGDYLEVQFNLYGQNGSNGSGALLFNLPSGYTIDTTKVPASTNDDIASRVGDVNIYNGTAGSHGHMYVYSSTQLAFKTLTDSSTYQTVNATFFNAANYMIQFTARIPILGWSSSVIMSSDADTRVVAAIFNQNTSQSGINTNNSAVKITLDTAARDTHGGVNTGSNRYDVKVSGYYQIDARLLLQASNVIAGSEYRLHLYKNGSQIARGQSYIGVASTTCNMSLSALRYLSAGDYIELYLYGQGNNSASTLSTYGDSSDSYYTSLSLVKVAGPAQIAASETVACRYTTATNQLLEASGSGEIINFDTKDYDTHGAVTTGASWKFTAPVSGIYSVRAMIEADTVSWTAGNSFTMYLRKGGSNYSILDDYTVEATTTRYQVLKGSDEVRLLAGEYVDVFVDHNRTSGDINLRALALINFIAIRRVGNY